MTVKERKEAQARFLDALGRTANITAACKAANISRRIVYVWQEMSDEFALQFREANQQANDLLFAEAWRRSMIGETRYVVSQGKLVRDDVGRPVTYQEKSDSLLSLLLKARLPEFREKQPLVEVSNVNVASATGGLFLDVRNATSEELEILHEIALAIMEREKRA
jgi:hypothetical protein